MSEPIVEARGTDSRLDLIRKLLAKAESTDSEPERVALVERASELIAKYGIDKAMLVDAGHETDLVVDKTIFVSRPYGKSFVGMLGYLARAMRAKTVSVKEWDPDDHGGRTKGAWKYGLRLFAHESDLARIELLYTSLRNQALRGASGIHGTAEFGQDRRAYVINYLQGFAHEVYFRVEAAEADAQAAREAEQTRLADEALLAGHQAGRSVELVLADRSVAVKQAFDLAVYGIDPAERARRDAQAVANRAKWDEQDRVARERRQARIAEQQSCPKCQQAKSGYCANHRNMRPVKGRQYTESVGADYYYTGRADGRRADLGVTSPQVGNRRQGELGR